MGFFLLLLILSTIAATQNQIAPANASLEIGVCYDRLGDNLPSPTDVVNLYKKYQIGQMRLFDPNPEILEALRGSGIQVTLGIKNQDVPFLATGQRAAMAWFAVNILPYVHDVEFPYIAVGNEAIPGVLSASVLPAMRNLKTILDSNNLSGIKVSTVVSSAVLANSYPPSSSTFTPEASAALSDILKFMSYSGSPLLINVYPFSVYAADPVNIRLDYALFTATGTVLQDGNLSYSNLFDASVDAFIWAMEKLGVSDVDVVISESGWPSAGHGNLTTPELALTYNKNYMNKVLNPTSGTPKRPGTYVEGFIFTMFNDNTKPAWGLFNPDMTPVYPLFS